MPEIGIFLVPGAEQRETTVAQAIAADESGLDYVAVQDHPYQRRFLDTWTFLAYVAGRTSESGWSPTSSTCLCACRR